MADWDDVRRIALALPETTERLSRGNAQWRVRDKLFVWERPLPLYAKAREARSRSDWRCQR
jgi:hypothetical protein